MANHNLPTVTSGYLNFVSELNGRLVDSAAAFDPAFVTVTNPPVNTVRFSSAAKTWQRWNGTAWVALATTYAINAATATNLSTNRNNWSTNGTLSAVVGQLVWRNFGNGHTIFDASASLSPDGAAVNNTNPQIPWAATYPTLMGWNGTATYGVRVDSARVADSAATATNATNATNAANLTGGAISGNYTVSNATSPNTNHLLFGDNSGWVYRFMTSVGGAPTVRFSFSDGGNFTAVGNVTAFSDIRLKTDIAKITDALAKVNQLNGYTYTRIDTGARQTGVIAQELQKVLPEAVGDDGETLSVAYGNMMGLMIEAVKELTARIEVLEAR